MLIVIQIIFAILTSLFIWKLVGIKVIYNGKYKSVPNSLHIVNLALCWTPIIGFIVTVAVILVTYSIHNIKLRKDRKLNQFLFGLSEED